MEATRVGRLHVHPALLGRQLLHWNRPRGLEARVAEHNAGTYDGYTNTRRPVNLIFSEWFDQITDAIAAERQVKGWSRAKKEALIRGDFGRLRELSKRRG
jgi:putative endonuclease